MCLYPGPFVGLGIMVLTMSDNHSNHILIQNLTVCYGHTIALDHVSGTLKPNALTAIFGPNGGGKSTFAKVLASLIKPAGEPLGTNAAPPVSPPICLNNAINRHFPVTVREVVAMGLWHQTGAFKRLTPEHQINIDQALERVGLQAYHKRSLENYPADSFSACFTRIILEDSSLIILDEPFTAIDLKPQTLMQLIQEWHAKGKTILVVLHDLEMARQYFPETILFARTCLGWGKTQQVLTDQNVMASYTRL